MMKMKLTPMETAANLSSKLEKNVLQRKQQAGQRSGGGAPMPSRSVNLKHQQKEGPNLSRLQTSKIGAGDDDGQQFQVQLSHQQRPQNTQHPQSAKCSTVGLASGGRDPMKRLLNHSSTKRATESAAIVRSNSDVVQIVTRNSGFSGEQQQQQQHQGVSRSGISGASIKSDERKKLTQMQIYNKMQQAKLLGRHSNNFPSQLPQVNKGSNALSTLLRYPSPKSLKQSLQPYHDHPAAANTTDSDFNSINSGNNQIQVQLDRSTKIFKDGLSDPKAPISPILSEGSIDSEEEEQTPLAIKSLKMMAEPTGNYEIVETKGQTSSSNILIKDYTSMVQVKKSSKEHQSPYHQSENDQIALQNALMSYPLPPVAQQSHQTSIHYATASAAVEGDSKDEPDFLSSELREATKALRVHGTHQNNQNLFFDTKQEDEKGKMMITVQAANASKFGLPTSAQQEKEYRLVKLNDKELSKVMSDETKIEIGQIHSIQQQKAEAKQDVYFEDIMTFPFVLNCQKERGERKRRNLNIGKRLQEDRENELWEKREQQLQNQQRRNVKNLDLAASEGHDQGAIGHNFNYMNIDELKQHEMGILNLFEGDKGLAGYVSHNKPGLPKPSTIGQRSKKYVRLSQFEYETIFEKDPSFNEKRAFVDVFRRKWKEDKGFCSMFNKRSKLRKAKSAALKNREKQQQAHQTFKSRKETQMLYNHQEKMARKNQERQEKEEQAQEIMAELKQIDQRQETRLQKKALRITEAKTPPLSRVKTAFQLTTTQQVPQLQQSQQNWDSQLFPLKKADSLEDIMQVMSNKAQAKIGSCLSPRAKSAHALGAKYRSNSRPGAAPQMVSQQPRVESSQFRQRDPSGKLTDIPYQSEADDIKLTGRQAPMHKPLQNHDPEYLSNFITQMYQTTNMQYVPPQKLEIDGNTNGMMGPNSDIEDGSIMTKNPPRYPETSENLIVGTLDSVGQKETTHGEHYDESRAGTMKHDEMRKTASDVMSGLVTSSQDQFKELKRSQESKTVGGTTTHVRMNESDIRIVTLPSKERVKVQDQNQLQQQSQQPKIQDQRNALQIQSVLDQQLLSFQYSRDPKSAKTLPIRRQLLLGQQEESQAEKAVLSQRNSCKIVQQKNLSPTTTSNGGVKVGSTMLMHADKNAASMHSERKPVVTSGIVAQSSAKNQLTINHVRAMEGIQSSEVKVYDSGRNYSNQQLKVKTKVRAPTADAQMFQSSGDQTAILDANRQSQQFTDSKDSKLSDEINDESFMQPKNQREDSYDSKGTPSAGKHALSSAYAHVITDQQVTYTNNEKTAAVLPQQLQNIKPAHKPKALVSEVNGPSHRREKSSNRRDLVKLRQPENSNLMIVSNRAPSSNRATRDIKVPNNGIYNVAEDDQTIVSRQQRITVNSSYGKRSDVVSKDITAAAKHGGQMTKATPSSTHNIQSNTIKNARSFGAGNSIIPNPQTKDVQMTSTLNVEGGPSSAEQMLSGENVQDPLGSKKANSSWQHTEPPQLDMYMQQVRPSVYNLPHNPMNHKSYKCNYIKSRVENTRMDFIQAQNQAHNFKVEPARISSAILSRTGVPPGDPNIYISESQASQQHLMGSYSSTGLSTSFGGNRTLGRQKSQTGTVGQRALSAVTRGVNNNAYMRNQKAVQLRKKEQQFYYYMQQQRQNEQLMKSLEKTAQTKASQRSTINGQLSYGTLAPQAKPNISHSRRSTTFRSRGASQTQNRRQWAVPPNDSAEDLVIAGTGGRKAFGGINHDIEIQGDMPSDHHIDSRLLETSSPSNRRVIENAYRDFDKSGKR